MRRLSGARRRGASLSWRIAHGNTAMFLTGVGCVCAAAVGGGLSVGGVSANGLTVLGSVVLGTIGLVLIVASLFFGVEPQPPEPQPPDGPTPTQLRADVEPFVGREEELDGVVAYARQCRDAPAVVLVYGPPGIGKTTFATHVGHVLTPEYEDGQVLVERLRGDEPTEDAATRRLRQVRGALERNPAPRDNMDEESAAYRTLLAQKRAIVMLDDAQSVPQLEPLLPGQGESLVLITSRHKLLGFRRRPHYVRLEPLLETQAIELLSAAAERKWTGPEHSDAEAVVHFCQCWPLALCIIGAKLASGGDMTIILSRLTRSRFDELRPDEPPALTPGLRASFELSYAELGEDAQRVLRALSIVPNYDYILLVAASISGLDLATTDHALRQLTTAQIVESRNNRRYYVHDLMHEFVSELAVRDHSAEREEMCHTVRRLIDSYADQLASVAETIEPVLPPDAGPPEQRPPPDAPLSDQERHAIAWFEDEYDNILAVLDAADQLGEKRAVCRLSEGFRPFSWGRSYTMYESIKIQELGLQSAEELGKVDARLRASLNLGTSYRNIGLPRESLERLHWCWEEATATGQAAMVAHSAMQLGHAYRELNDVDKARKYYGLAGREYERLGWRARVAAVTANLGLLEWHEGNLAGARDRLGEAVARFEAMPCHNVADRREAAWAAENLGDVLIRSRRPKEAEPYLRSSLATFPVLRDKQGQAYALRDLGDLSGALGRMEDAQTYYSRSMEQFSEIGDERGKAYVHLACSMRNATLRQYRSAGRHLRCYSAIARRLGDGDFARRMCGVVADVLRVGLIAVGRDAGHGYRYTPR